MRITLVVRRYWPAPGGVETFMRHVATALAERHDVTVRAHTVEDHPGNRLSESLRPAPTFEPFEDGGVRVVPIRFTATQRAGMAPVALQAVPGPARFAYGRMRVPLAACYAAVAARALDGQATPPDVIHAFSADLVGAAARRAAHLAEVPFVITPFVHPGQWGEDPASIRTYRGADRVIGLVEVEREIFRGFGVPDERIAVCGVCSPGVAPGGGAEVRARHGVEGPLVLFLGVRRRYKGHELLLAAREQVARAHPDTTFVFVGPGDAIAGSQDVARFIDVGAVGEAERGAWLEAADVMCLPSAHEIFPVSALEAWSVGTPVLFSDLPPLVELVRRSGGGMTVPRTAADVGSALSRLLSDPHGLRAMGEAGRRFWAEGHTPRAAASRHEEIYLQARDA